MQVPDVFRAQYYLSGLENNISNLRAFINQIPFVFNPETICEKFASDLAVAIDQIILPTIAFEIHQNKNSLTGSNSQARYDSFFVKNGSYTDSAVSILERYPFLFNVIDNYVTTSFQNLRNCLDAFQKDYKSSFFPSSLLMGIRILESSDRHRSRQSLLLEFMDNLRVIYKPVDLIPDQLLKEFIHLLDFPYPYDLKYLDVAPMKGYGWIRYVDQYECSSMREVEDFYRRFGALISVADALNYTDGHCENVYASGAYPILLDGETLFQNFTAPIAKEKNVLSTLLIQKNDVDSEKLCSALQSPSDFKVEGYYTHALNDHTDNIQICYSGLSREPCHHVPRYQGKERAAFEFKDFVLEGYEFGFDWISNKIATIQNSTKWWKQVAQVHSRTVLRETSAYFYLIRRLQHPDLICSRKLSESFLWDKLEESYYTEYEVSDLLEMNIPYFYQQPGKKDIFDGNNKMYRNAFSNTAVECMQWQFENRTVEKKEFDCEIIRRHLVPLSTKITQKAESIQS